MRIRLLTNIGSRDSDIEPRLMEGQEREVDESTGQKFIARQWAVDITPPPPVIQSVPELPAIAEAKAPEIAPVAEKPKKSQFSKPAVLPVKNPDKET